MSEHDEQVTVIEWAEQMERTWPELCLLFAVPNAGGYTGGYKQNVRRVQAMKKEGVKSGVPDLMLPVARRGHHGLFLEMKTAKGVATANQIIWVGSLKEQGYCARVCQGADEAIKVLKWYLDGTV